MCKVTNPPSGDVSVAPGQTLVISRRSAEGQQKVSRRSGLNIWRKVLMLEEVDFAAILNTKGSLLISCLMCTKVAKLDLHVLKTHIKSFSGTSATTKAHLGYETSICLKVTSSLLSFSRDDFLYRSSPSFLSPLIPR
ncbi:hypothetical protein OYC64_011958 [Pagothenia borchgrevinki]|uniref:Uncharacterized protein n=1 Tax=Pagothenia borchgrevinki TaxID=8213 RepID=A0ABD2FHI5_PAGBO